MVFLDFLKNLGLNLEMFCPFDIEVVDAKSNSSSDVDKKRNILLNKKFESMSEDFSFDGEGQSCRPCLDQSMNVQSSASNLTPNDRSCSNCDFCQPDEDFETGSDGIRCSVRGFVIYDAHQCASTCSSYCCSEAIDEM